MKKRVIFSAHAIQRMTQRSIRIPQVIEAIDAPDQIRHTHQERKIAVKWVSNRKVHVVYKEESVTIIVITVY
ncbi:MAG: DUF4258 domain-containing protein [Candidatus Diapherotrites archaeon]|nr:DUF4258 domain-containing protein [Candidatus Diapherotrites archaeon]